MNELHLFAGAGGGILGGMLLGHRPVCAVEIDKYCRRVLIQRQRDGMLPWFPIWDDVRTFDGTPWRGLIDCICGGFPCQDISVAGTGGGIDGERSGLWSEYARIIREVRPRYLFVENSPALTSRGLGRVLGDMAALGFNAEWGVVSAEDAIWLGGTPAVDHLRERIWILGVHAHADSVWQPQPQGGVKDERGWIGHGGQTFPQRADANDLHAQRQCRFLPDSQVGEVKRERPIGPFCDGNRWWLTEPDVGRVADGVANRVDRLKSIGNGQVPVVAALAWRLLMMRISNS